jgi:MFS family permease
VTSLGATACCDRLNSQLGRRRSYVLGCAITALGSMLCLFIGTDAMIGPNEEAYNYGYVCGAAFVFGIGTSIVMVTGVSFVNDVIGDNLSTSAFVYGCMSLTDKLFSGLIIMAIQQRRNTLCEGDETSQDDDSIEQCGNFVKQVMVWVPIGCCAIATATLPFVKIASKKKKKSKAGGIGH